MNTIDREPYWLSKKDLRILQNLFSEMTNTNETVEGIKQEITVAKARRDTHKAIELLTRALGLSKGAVPVYLTVEEVTYLKSLPSLDTKIKSKLT